MREAAERLQESIEHYTRTVGAAGVALLTFAPDGVGVHVIAYAPEGDVLPDIEAHVDRIVHDANRTPWSARAR